MIYILRVFMNYDYYITYKNLKDASNIKNKTTYIDIVFNASYFQFVKFQFKMYQTA